MDVYVGKEEIDTSDTFTALERANGIDFKVTRLIGSGWRPDCIAVVLDPVVKFAFSVPCVRVAS